MADENFAHAVDRVQAATTAKGTTLAPLHLRYELKMVDYKGNPHTGTYEFWNSAEGNRTEIHTDTYNGVELAKDGRWWVVEDGLRPLRVMEFMAEQQMPTAAVKRSLSGGTKLKSRQANGVSLMCGGNGGSATVCFDPSSGFIVFATVDGELVEYEAWRRLGGPYMAGVVRISRLGKLLVEAKMTLASGAVSPEAFAIPSAAVESNVSLDAVLLNFDQTDVSGGAYMPLSPGPPRNLLKKARVSATVMQADSSNRHAWR